jgi:ribokinase
MNRVVVIGNVGLDLRLVVPRLPLAGETLIGAESARAPGGKGLNQAVVVARCGARVRFCAPLGNDEPQAHEVKDHLPREPFDEVILPRLPHPTDFSLLMVLPGGENSIVSTSACSPAMDFAQVEPAFRDLGKGGGGDPRRGAAPIGDGDFQSRAVLARRRGAGRSLRLGDRQPSRGRRRSAARPTAPR